MRSCILLLLLSAAAIAQPPVHPPEGTEFAEMLSAILGGSKMGPSEGWFHPGEKLHTWEMLAEWHKIKPTESLTKKTFRGPPDVFARLDRDGDGVIQADDFDWSDKSPYLRQLGHARQILRRGDKNNDGTLTLEEWNGLFKKAIGDDGELTPEKLRAVLYPPSPPQMFSNSADEPSMAILLKGLFKAEIGAPLTGPHVGDKAPDFRLKPVGGGEPVSLSQFQGKTPVVLCFGNFSCGPYRSQYQSIEALKKAYGDRVTFLGVYVREAHPTDGWRMFSNDRGGISIAQPKTDIERWGVAETCSAKLKMTMPLLVDEISDPVGMKYSGMPSRLYLIDRSGTVLYKSGRGPFGFKPGELDQAISLLMTKENLVPLSPDGRGVRGEGEIADSDPWKKLPATVQPMAGPLPVWAKELAGPLPRTTAAMLELDYVQRMKSPLDPKLRAKVRWAAARANRCSYGEEYALADLRRVGGTEAEVTALLERSDDVPEAERLALRLATDLTKRAANVSDKFFEQVRSHFGNEATVAIVLCVAYANFQDRLSLAYGWKVEEGGPLSPLAVAFRTPFEGAIGDARYLPVDRPTAYPPARIDDPEWLGVNAVSLRQSMESQSARTTRISIPTFEDLKRKLPPNSFASGQTVKINWSLVCTGYQPELAQAWLKCLRTFATESKQDRAFEECLFWVVTRSLDCFY